MTSTTFAGRMLTGTSFGVVAAMAVATAMVLGGAGRAAASDQEVRDAGKMVTTNAKVIQAFAYPTTKKLTGTEFVKGVRNADGGFSLTYNFDYVDSDGDDAYVTLKFTFTASGKMKKVEEVSRSSFWPAFGTAKLALEVLKESIRNDEKARNSPEGMRLLAIDDPTDFLVELLNIKAGK
ncbi:MAG: hypothetical protein K2P78_08765 [Gemmataceae bacterium]|nr:hypothetical protein [Gemmataceae bacterium]